LNIWTPAKRQGERLPVIVWIHGGGCQFGLGRWPLFEGSALARLGVVLVTLSRGYGRAFASGKIMRSTQNVQGMNG
jgi:para-nitrobenzyl esterase